MARKKKTDTTANNGAIPQRVDDAARNMIHQAAGPSRGYVPQRNPQPQSGWQQVPPGYYPGQTPQQNNAYYTGQQQPLNGAQRGYIVPAGHKGKDKKPRKRHPVLLILLLIMVAGAIGTGAFFQSRTSSEYEKSTIRLRHTTICSAPESMWTESTWEA